MTTRSQPQIAGNVLVILNPSKRQKACGIGDSCVESSACDTSHTLMAMQSTSFARVKNFLPIASAVFMVENVLSTWSFHNTWTQSISWLRPWAKAKQKTATGSVALAPPAWHEKFSNCRVHLLSHVQLYFLSSTFWRTLLWNSLTWREVEDSSQSVSSDTLQPTHLRRGGRDWIPFHGWSVKRGEGSWGGKETHCILLHCWIRRIRWLKDVTLNLQHQSTGNLPSLDSIYAGIPSAPTNGKSI